MMYLDTHCMSRAAAKQRRRAPTRVERQARTRTELIDAAERLFTAQGFHAASLEAVADDAGYTRGAVYSNFASKEDLFFAVYERRVERFLPELALALAAAADVGEALLSVMAAHRVRREREPDGWLTVFLEFWTHVLRHPEHRARFAAIHRRYLDPIAAAVEHWAGEHRVELPVDAQRLTIAVAVMGTGLGLERLTQPEVVDAEFTVVMHRLILEGLLARAEPGTSPPNGAIDELPRDR
jgi:AcrR family transcriptional regulator